MPYLRCTITRYSIDYDPDPHPLSSSLRTTTSEETTGFHVRDGWLYLHNSAASTRVENLLNGAREGRDWTAQCGTPPIFVDGEGWGGRNWPKIEVSAEALLEALEETCKT